MKTEKEICDKYKILKESGSKSKVDELILFSKLDILLWILTCETCKKYPCTCYDTF